MYLGILTSHPIQYNSPWFRALAQKVDLKVYYAHQQTPRQQADAGFGVAFDWDIDLLSGFEYKFLRNVAHKPNVNNFWGCDTPDIMKEIHRQQFDAFIVMGWYLKCYWQAIWACHHASIPVFVRGDSQLLTPRSSLKQMLKTAVYPLLFRQIDGFLVVGQLAREYLQYYKVPDRKLFHVPHFIDNAWFQKNSLAISPQQRHQIRLELGATDEDTVILFVGKFMKLKRPLDVIEALQILHLQSCKVHGVFVGDGELTQTLSEAAEKANVTCRFEGFRNQTELPQYYAGADVLVLPSDSETWGLVVNEAMACGLPAIVSDSVGCGPDLVTDTQTGYTFPTGNSSALADCIKALILRKRSGYNFQTAVRAKINNYSIDVAVERTRSAIQTVIGSSQGKTVT